MVLLVRYLVDNYNRKIDARMGDQSLIGRWEAGRIARSALLGERELDICLMRRDRRRVYRSGYVQFANLTYSGEHLAAYEGESVIIRYDPRDITTIWVYQERDGKERFLTRAHALGWETETLSHGEARAIGQRRRRAGEALGNRSMLEEVRDRDEAIEELQRRKRKKSDLNDAAPPPPPSERAAREVVSLPVPEVEPATAMPGATGEAIGETMESEREKKPVPYVAVHDYEELKRRAGRW